MHFSKPSLKPSLLALLSGLLLAPGLTARAAEPRLALNNSAAPAAALRGARALGALPADQTLHLALTLPLRNQAGLQALLKHQYTPGDPLYRHFLTRDQFTAQFGPTEADYEAAARWAQAQGLTVTETYATRTLLNVSGSTSQVQKAFAVQINHYRMPNGRTAYASLTAASLPQSIAGCLSGVIGLSNLAQPHYSLIKHAATVRPNTKLRPNAGLRSNAAGGINTTLGYGPLGFLAPNDIKYAYGLSTITPLYGPVTVGGLNGQAYSAAATTTMTTVPTLGAAATPTLLDGKGQTIGLFELDGFDSKDIDQYITYFNLPSITSAAAAAATPTGTPTVQRVLIGGYNGTPLSAEGQGEATLDIDMALALAPNASIIVYAANPNTNPSAIVNTYQRMANDTATDGTPLLQVISTSIGYPETLQERVTVATENTIFQQMAAQGQTFYAASGDSGAYGAYPIQDPTTQTSILVQDPATQPYVTGVGGTTLSYKKSSVSAAGVTTPGQYQGEIVWNTGTLSSAGGPVGGGGGSSEIWPKPNYQTGYGTSPTRRDAPDVSLNSDPNTGYDIFIGGQAVTTGGTSAAAPLWAGYTALINQRRTANGLPSLGFLNPQLYPLLSDTAYPTLFHDITQGDNLLYEAQPGYDDATGVGSFIGASLLNRLSFNADAGAGTATLSGTVTDATTLAPIAGAIVTVTSTTSSQSRGTITTNSSGAYTLTVPASLSLTVTVNVPSASTTGTTGTTGTTIDTGTVYAGQSSSGITVAADGSATLDFALTPAHPFAPGLQMISAPYDFTGVGDFASLFGLSTPLSSTSARLIQWLPSQSVYAFYPTAPADTLRLGQGYWVRFTQTSYIALAGTVASSTQPFSISLTAGWNQIGDPFTGSVLLSGATVSSTTGGSATSLAASTLVQPTLFSYSGTANNYLALDPSAGTLDPYQGYWIYARQNAILTLPVPASLPPPPIIGGGLPGVPVTIF